jgi:hypothetical protein
MIETIEIAEPWLYATLSEDDVLAGLVGDRITGTLAPDILDTPYISFLLQSPLDVMGIGATRISTDNLYIVKAVTQGSSWDEALPIAQRIDYLIHRPNSTMIQGTGSLTCNRERVFQQPEVAEGIQYRHLGGIYRIRASADE